MRYKMIIAYDGAFFHGFQRQTNLISVQSVLEETLTEILKTEVVIHGAGRTDALVHAYGQVVHFDSEQLVPPKNLKKIVNKKVYPHIYVSDIEIVDESFHSRKSAKGKEYHYIVDIGEYDPLQNNYVLYHHNRIDIEKIKQAMTYIVGTHDFKSLSKNKELKTTTRTIKSFELIVEGTRLTFKIVGNGFMYNMVRIIVALMLKVGEGKLEVEDVQRIIAAKNRKLVPWVAPARGLYLMKVFYEEI